MREVIYKMPVSADNRNECRNRMMKGNRLVCFLLLLCLFFSLTTVLDAESFDGRVVDENGEGIANAVIWYDGKQIITQDDGRFSLTEEPFSGELLISRIGYKSEKISSSSLKENRTIILIRESVTLDSHIVRSVRESIFAGRIDRIVINVTQEMRGKSLAEAIKSYPDINVSGASLFGERQTATLSGHQSRHLQVVLDGVVLNRPGQPFDIASIPLDSIETIEIIKGGGSAFTGSGAIAGIINISTAKSSYRHDYTITQTAGSFSQYKTALRLERLFERYRLYLYTDKSSAKNDFTYLDRNNDKQKRSYNDKSGETLHFNLMRYHHIYNMQYKLEFGGFNNKLPGPTNYEILYHDSRLTGYNLRNSLLFNFGFGRTRFETLLYHHLDRSEYDNTRSQHPFYRIRSEHVDSKRGLRIGVTAEYLGMESRLAIEHNREDFHYNELTNEANSIPKVFSENSAAQISLVRTSILKEPLRWDETGIEWYNRIAARVDYSNRWQSNYSWRYDTALEIESDLSTKIGGSAGSNYAIPSFYELFWKGDFQTTGNPNLKPERSDNLTAFGEISYKATKLRLEYDYSQISDMIYWFRSITGWKPGNIAETRILNRGFSLNTRILKSVALGFSYLETDAVNKSRKDDGSPADFFGKKLLYTPEKNYNFQIRHDFREFYWQVNHSFTGEQWSTLDQLIPPLDSYSLTDAEFGLIVKPQTRLLENSELAFSILLRNIFDKSYEIYAYTPQPGFNWMLNISINYKK